MLCASMDRTARQRFDAGRGAAHGGRRPSPCPRRAAPQPQSAAVALRTLGGIDALIALQGIEDPVERRRRAVKQGTRALDALDELKLGLLAGSIDQGMLLRLKAVAADLKEGSGDEGWIRCSARSTCGLPWNWPRPE